MRNEEFSSEDERNMIVEVLKENNLWIPENDEELNSIIEQVEKEGFAELPDSLCNSKNVLENIKANGKVLKSAKIIFNFDKDQNHDLLSKLKKSNIEVTTYGKIKLDNVNSRTKSNVTSHHPKQRNKI